MRRAVLLARMKPVPRASSAEGPPAHAPPQTSSVAPGASSMPSAAARVPGEREASRDAQAAGHVEGSDAARRRIDDGVAVDARETRALRVAERGGQATGRDVRRRLGRARPR
jgi:hypothetical protein